VILTTECNLKCGYCFGEAQKDFDPDFSDLEIDYASPQNFEFMKFNGCEIIP
jgi:molybdenum cofactor biosynthesis enzyme MoaA